MEEESFCQIVIDATDCLVESRNVLKGDKEVAVGIKLLYKMEGILCKTENRRSLT